MKISLETKFTTFTSLITGGICAYSAPGHYLSGLTAGLFIGNFLAKHTLTHAKTTSLTPYLGDPQHKAIEILSESLPGWEITSFNMTACLTSKIALPIFQSLSSTLTSLIGLFTGCVITRLFALNNLETWAQHTQSTRIIELLQDKIL